MNNVSFTLRGKEDSKLGYNIPTGFTVIDNGKILVSSYQQERGNYIMDCFDLLGCSRDCAYKALEDMFAFHKIQSDPELENDIVSTLMLMVKAFERKALAASIELDNKKCCQTTCGTTDNFETTDID